LPKIILPRFQLTLSNVTLSLLFLKAEEAGRKPLIITIVIHKQSLWC